MGYHQAYQPIYIIETPKGKGREKGERKKKNFF
jgi:hypothetical protein